MQKNESNNHKCELCRKNVADKTNSHIVPSFILCKTASADGSGKRNHELAYSIGKVIHAYSGNEVPQEIMERNFDDLSDERITEELKKNVCAEDYVFCSSCEKSMGYYLESPYAANNNNDAKTAYFFWMSIIWRLSHFNYYSQDDKRMPKFMISELRKSLDMYLQTKRDGIDSGKIKQKYPFKYRIIRCCDYSKDGGGAIYSEYDKVEKIFSITCGDLIGCFSFNGNDMLNNYHFLGIEDVLKLAPLNNGDKPEKVKNVPESVFHTAYMVLMEIAKTIYLNNEVKKIIDLWNALKKTHEMPSPQPSDLFIRRCINIAHDSNKKNGEKHTYRNFAISFANALTEVYGIQFEDDKMQKNRNNLQVLSYILA